LKTSPHIARGRRRSGKWWSPKEREMTMGSEVTLPAAKLQEVGGQEE